MLPRLPNFPLSLYVFFGYLSFFALLVFNLQQLDRKQHLLSRRARYVQRWFAGSQRFQKAKFLSSVIFWAAVETILISFIQYFPISTLNTWFGDLVGTGANYYGLMYGIPIILTVLFLILWVDPLKQMDLITPAFPLALAFSKTGCFCAGCCTGIECSFGFYNHATGLTEFPTQMLESLVALGILAVLLYICDKVKTGTLFPIYLILYSATRFFTEFTRSEENVLWIFKIYHILCLCGVVVGIALLLLVRKFGERISKVFDEDKTE